MDSSDDQRIEGTAEVSPIKKNKRGKIIGSRDRLLIVNMYKSYIEKDPTISMRKMRMIISKSMGIGESTVLRTINEYKETNAVTSPKRKRVRTKLLESFDDFARNAVRRHVHNIFFCREIPTVDKIYKAVADDENLPTVSRTSLFKLLKELQFRFVKRSRNSALTERTEIILWRRRYLRTIEQFRKEGRHVYYLDETWINAGDCTNYVWRDEILHIGSEDGFVPGGLLCFKLKNNTLDYHDEVNGQTFYEWMKNILPRLQDNSVIVMDNASYHSVKLDKIPTTSTKKADIIKWLEDKGEVVDKSMIIKELLQVVKKYKPLYEKYVIDEMANAHNKTILRIPPYHCELNPFELAWSSIKNYIQMNNTTYKLPDVKKLLLEGIERVDADMWKNFINHTKEEEKKFWEIDEIIDEVLEAEKQNLTITGNTSSDSESESD